MWMADVATLEYYIDGAPSPSDFGFLGAGGSTRSSEPSGGISSLTMAMARSFERSLPLGRWLMMELRTLLEYSHCRRLLGAKEVALSSVLSSGVGGQGVSWEDSSPARSSFSCSGVNSNGTSPVSAAVAEVGSVKT